MPELGGVIVQLDAPLSMARRDQILGGTVLLTVNLTRHVVKEAIESKATVIVTYRM